MRLALAAVLSLSALPVRAAVDIQEVTSPGGIDAWLVEDHTIPFTALEIRFGPGAVLDRPGKRGAINLMAATLEEGTGDLDAQAFAAARDDLAADFSYNAYDDAVSISARFLTENRDDAVDLLRRSLVEPSFPQDAVDRVRDQVLSNIRSDATDPGSIARREWDARAFGDHPYGSVSDGTIESVTDLTRDDVVQAHRDVLVRDNVYVGAVGDITPDELGAILDELFSDLPQSTAAEIPGDAGWKIAPGVEVIEYPTPQAVILFGHEGIERDDPDFFAAYILNEIFGGSGFNSRLMEEVRVKRGLTYGIGTFLAPMDFAEYVGGQAQSSNATAAELIDVVRAEWDRVADGVTEEELDAAKTYLTGSYPLRFDGNANIASILVGMQLDDLPTSYIATRNDKIEAVTLDDIARVAERVYRGEDLSFLVVGDPDGVGG
ncbi:M16 family metallopeptidase [Palleronia sp. THAF1]|uniref:M16 family metallopeptidase n=1 Tax=Palleronia sp. THAF1 TaxID=2587842 RepID=UPI000F526393|nr:pitrilysin family protein [Palleronia sp. THAF1]